MAGFALMVKTKGGREVIKNLGPDSTIEQLKATLSEKFNIPINKLHVLTGFPPKPFDLTRESLNLKTSGLSSGETLILEEKEQPDPPPKPRQEPQGLRAQLQTGVVEQMAEGIKGILMKKVVPADNSCLFGSIYFALNGKMDETGQAAPGMRELIASHIQNNKEVYTEAMLGKSVSDYCKWIKDDKSWGGGIEVAILSSHFGIEIVVVDTTSTTINRFGEDKQYDMRMLLLFDGIHYDPLYYEPLDGSANLTLFPIDDESVLRDAKQLAEEAKSSRQFTDVHKFTLKCMVCDTFLTGQVQATQHAQSTGHSNFGEV